MQRIYGCLTKRKLAKPTTKVKPRPICVGDAVLKMAGQVQKGLNTSKFAPTLEGLYIIKEAYHSGCYRITKPELEELLPLYKAKWLKLYFS